MGGAVNMDALLSAAPSGVLESLVEVVVEFVSCGLGLALVLWMFGFAWEIVVGFVRDLVF